MRSTHSSPTGDHQPRPRTARRPLLDRDIGLQRLSRLTRWSVAGAVVLTAAMAKLAADSFPGHTARAQASTASAARLPSSASRRSASPATGSSGAATGSASSSSSPGTAGPASGSSDPVPQAAPAPPPQLPQPSSDTGGAVSGGS